MSAPETSTEAHAAPRPLDRHRTRHFSAMGPLPALSLRPTQGPAGNDGLGWSNAAVSGVLDIQPATFRNSRPPQEHNQLNRMHAGVLDGAQIVQAFFFAHSSPPSNHEC